MEAPTLVTDTAGSPLARRPIAIFSVASGPDGTVTKYASVLTPDQVRQKRGLRLEAILGRFKDANGPVAPENFVQNRTFVSFLQDVIGKHAAACPALLSEAQRIRKGLVYVLDGRRDPSRQPAPEDILGTAIVDDSRITGYEPAGGYVALTHAGFLFLEEWLHARLIEALLALPVAKVTLEQAPD